ncbi:MAG: hypothetical protein WCR95_00710 [Eubacteriales bacterium]
MRALSAFSAVFLVFMLAFSFSPAAAAFESSREDDIAKKSGADKLPVGEIISPEEKTGKEKIDIADKIFSVLKKSITGFYKSGLRFFYSLVGVIALSALLLSFKRTSENAAVKAAYEYISVLALAGALFHGLQGLFVFAAQSFDRLCVFMASLLPVTASLYTLGGNFSSGVAGSSSLLMFLTVAEKFSASVLRPLLMAGFVVSVMGALPGSADMRSVTNFLKSVLTTLMAFVFTLFGVVMYFQTIIAAAADNYVFRTVKFASGVFIPVIGNIVGEAARNVSSAVGVVRSTVGAIGLVSISALVLPAVIYVIMHKIFVLMAAMLARLLGLEKESAMLYDVNGFLNILMSLLVGTSVIFIIAVALFIKIGVGD